jgi:hypothetical protein
VCDGFVVGGGALRVMREGSFAAEVNMPFWLQLVGTGLTAAFSLHFGAVLSQARWPAVNCHQLFTHTLLQQPIPVKEGFADIPQKAGLGYDLDRDAVQRFKVPKPTERPDPPRLVETSWPDGRRMYFANNEYNFMVRHAAAGKIPYYERGAMTRRLPDDGSDKWRMLYEKARQAPFLLK